MPQLNETHDPARRSWVQGADDLQTDFPIQNLPYGAFSVGDGPIHIGVAIGTRILDLTLLERQGLLTPGGDTAVFADGVLNPFMALPQPVWGCRCTAISVGPLRGPCRCRVSTCSTAGLTPRTP